MGSVIPDNFSTCIFQTALLSQGMLGGFTSYALLNADALTVSKYTRVTSSIYRYRFKSYPRTPVDFPHKSWKVSKNKQLINLQKSK